LLNKREKKDLSQYRMYIHFFYTLIHILLTYTHGPPPKKKKFRREEINNSEENCDYYV